MIYYNDGELVIRNMEEADAQVFLMNTLLRDGTRRLSII